MTEYVDEKRAKCSLLFGKNNDANVYSSPEK